MRIFDINGFDKDILECEYNDIADLVNHVRGLELSSGQNCEIFKSDKAWNEMDDNDIIYIPDIMLNDLTEIFEGCFSFYDIKQLIENIYTKADFINIAGDKAEELFHYVDWQHPESAWDAGELED